MEVKDVGYAIQRYIDENYDSLTDFCEKEKIGYKKFADKLKRMKHGRDFRFEPINKILNRLGYDFAIVKNDK